MRSAGRVKPLGLGLGALALLALLLIGLSQLSTRSRSSGTARSRLTLAQMQAHLAGSPAPLAALHAQAGRLLPGGGSALHSRLASLHGRPVVINKWASWCGPCVAEFGAFQRASIDLGREVAFIGINSGDSSHADALAFLRSTPVSYPSYYDASGSLGTAVTDSSSMPVTVFYDRAGGEFIHQGPYTGIVKLEQDVRRYALDPGGRRAHA
jgi:cytochrome c biogenesis protein CcmG/thiol:disulfide interchange protein DsbE